MPACCPTRKLPPTRPFSWTLSRRSTCTNRTMRSFPTPPRLMQVVKCGISGSRVDPCLRRTPFLYWQACQIRVDATLEGLAAMDVAYRNARGESEIGDPSNVESSEGCMDWTQSVRTVVFASVVCSCASSSSPADGVGDECRVSIVPVGGYTESAAAFEAGNAQCPSSVCVVDHVRGNPNHVCEGSPTDEPDCVPAEVIRERIYCTCPCDGTTSLSPLCDCPSGFACRRGVGTELSFCFRE